MSPDRLPVEGSWWPHSRTLGVELADLFTSWPTDAGYIVRVLYSPPDWDDRPRSASVPGRRIKTGCFPEDDTHRLVLTMSDGRRLPIGVIPPETSEASAATLLGDASGLALASVAPGASAQLVTAAATDDSVAAWDNEGGHRER